jgi:hypothetical protein
VRYLTAYQKKQALAKLSEMDKYIQGDVVVLPSGVAGAAGDLSRRLQSSISEDTRMSDDQVSCACQHPMRDVVSSMGALDMMPTLGEMFRMLCQYAGVAPDPGVHANLGNIRSALLSGLGEDPRMFDAVVHLAQTHSTGQPSKRIVEIVLPLQEKRALAEDYLMRRYVPEELGVWSEMIGVDPHDAYYSRPQELLTMDAPGGGQRATQRIVAEKMDLKNKQRKAFEAGVVASGTGLGFGAMHLLGKVNPVGRLGKWPVLAAGALTTGAVLSSKDPEMVTREGVRIPANTPMVKRSTAVRPNIAHVAIMWPHMHKTAQAGASGLLPQGSVPQDATLALQKIASQLAAADRASLEAEARLYGAAVMDGILSRGEQTIKAAQDAGVFPAQVAQPQPQGEIDLYHVAATSAQKTAEYIGQQQRKTAEAQQADLDLYQVAATSAQKTAAFIAQQHKAAAASQASDPRVLHVPPPATSPSALEVQKVAQDLTSVCTQAFEQGHAMAAGVVAQLAGHAQ